jgi:hypothetical protein
MILLDQAAKTGDFSQVVVHAGTDLQRLPVADEVDHAFSKDHLGADAIRHVNPEVGCALDSAEEFLAMLEESDFNWLTDDAGATEVVADLEKLIAVRQRSRHVGVVNGELFAVEAVEDSFIVTEGLLGLGDATILVDDDASAAICALAGGCEVLQAGVSVTGCRSESALSYSRTYHKLESPRGMGIRGQTRQFNHPADLDACAPRAVTQLRRVGLSEQIGEAGRVARQSSRVELVASAVAEDDLDIFSLVHDGVLVCCGGYKKSLSSSKVVEYKVW